MKTLIRNIGARVGRCRRGRGQRRQGLTVTPGLIDFHCHPVLGDFMLRQRTVLFIDAGLNGGLTTMIPVGEVHLPGRPTDSLGSVRTSRRRQTGCPARGPRAPCPGARPFQPSRTGTPRPQTGRGRAPASAPSP
jgi:hypothetical protein